MICQGVYYSCVKSVEFNGPGQRNLIISGIYICRALHTLKLDIGYRQKAGDIANLNFGCWILPTENGILEVNE